MHLTVIILSQQGLPYNTSKWLGLHMNFHLTCIQVFRLYSCATHVKHGKERTESYTPNCKTPATIPHGPIYSNDLNDWMLITFSMILAKHWSLLLCTSVCPHLTTTALQVSLQTTRDELILTGFLHQKLVTFLQTALLVFEMSSVCQCLLDEKPSLWLFTKPQQF